MNWLVIENVRPWDGRYEFAEIDTWTTREWGWVKRLSGYLPLTVYDGFKGGDPELFAVMAVIVLHRVGKVTAAEVPDLFAERFADVPFGSAIRLEGEPDEQEETDAGPPTVSSNGSSSTSGDDSRTSSGPSGRTLPASGIPASATSTSARPASAR